MKVLCVIDIDEDRLRSLALEDQIPYEFDSAFKLEMRWLGVLGMKMEGFAYLSDSEASDILTRYM